MRTKPARQAHIDQKATPQISRDCSHCLSQAGYFMSSGQNISAAGFAEPLSIGC